MFISYVVYEFAIKVSIRGITSYFNDKCSLFINEAGVELRSPLYHLTSGLRSGKSDEKARSQAKPRRDI